MKKEYMKKGLALVGMVGLMAAPFLTFASDPTSTAALEARVDTLTALLLGYFDVVINKIVPIAFFVGIVLMGYWMFRRIVYGVR